MRLIPPPHDAALRACMAWWRGLDPEHRPIFDRALLNPLTWWTVQAHYLDRTVKCYESHLFNGEIDATTPYPTTPQFAFCFEWATVFGEMGNWQWATKKTFGKLLQVRAMREDDPMDSLFCLVQHNHSSPWNHKWRQRDWMKRRLGAKARKVVNFARKSTWQNFQGDLIGGEHVFSRRFFDADNLLTDLLHQMKAGTVKAIRWAYPEKFRGEAVTVKCRNVISPKPEWQGFAEHIQRRLKMTLNQFWRACKGLDMIPDDQMIETVQREFAFS